MSRPLPLQRSYLETEPLKLKQWTGIYDDKRKAAVEWAKLVEEGRKVKAEFENSPEWLARDVAGDTFLNTGAKAVEEYGNVPGMIEGVWSLLKSGASGVSQAASFIADNLRVPFQQAMQMAEEMATKIGLPESGQQMVVASIKSDPKQIIASILRKYLGSIKKASSHGAIATNGAGVKETDGTYEGGKERGDERDKTTLEDEELFRT